MLINISATWLLYKELSVAIFDPLYARVIGFSPVMLHYGLMIITSITAVGAFDVVGSMVVVALMIVPPAAAYCITHRLSAMIWLTVLISALSAIGGYGIAYLLDVSIAGSIALMSGLLFCAAVVSRK